MITLAELKYFLNLNEDNPAKEIFLANSINRAIAEIDNICNRRIINFEDREYFNPSVTNDIIYIRNAPLREILEIKVFENNEWGNLITGTIADSTILYSNHFALNDNYSFNQHKGYYVKYKGGYVWQIGTGTISVTGNAITGVGTLFTNEAMIGNEIVCENQRFVINSITNNTEIVSNNIAVEEITDKLFYISSAPADLSDVCLKLAHRKFYETPYGADLLYVSSKNMAAGSSSGATYKNYNARKDLEKYIIQNI